MYINEYKYNINKVYVDKFWSNINNKDWIYVDDQLIDWIGFNTSTGRAKFLHLIKENFKENINFKIYDYKKITEIFHSPLGANENNKEILAYKDKLKNIHNRTTHLILSPKCFKKSLMMIRTEKANQIRDYYVDIEDLCLEFNKYLLENKNTELQNKDKELEDEKKKNFKLSDNLKNFTHLEKTEHIYIVTSKTYAAKNIFKIGKAKDCTARLCSYNTGKHSDDLNYFCYIHKCYNSVYLESLINSFLYQYRDKHSAEVFIINYKYLEKIVKYICEKYDNITDYFNTEIIENLAEIASEEPIIPKSILEKQETKPKKSNFGKSSVIFNKDIENMIYLDEKYIEENNLICSELQYYLNNANNPYYIIQKPNISANKNNKMHVLDCYICNKCYKKFRAIGELKSHFNRISDCDLYVLLLSQDSNNPKIYTYKKPDTEFEYKYYCLLNYEKQRIIYYCNTCHSQFNFKNNLLSHFDRNYDCSDTKWNSNKSENIVTDMKYFNNIIDNAYYQIYDSEMQIWMNVCNKCKKKSKWGTFMKEHFNRLNKCKDIITKEGDVKTVKTE